MNILEWKIKDITNTYNNNIEHLKRMMEGSPETIPLLRKMLLTNNLANVFGCGLSGYWISWFGDPFEKLDFITRFIRHEILDDGSPVVSWYKYDDYKSWVECEKEDDGARPFVRRFEFDDWSKNVYAYEDKVIEIIDFYEKKEEERLKFYNEDLEQDEKVTPPSKMFVELVRELGI